MTRFVFLFADGAQAAVKTAPQSVSLRRDADTPADSLELTFETAKPLFSTEPCGLRMERDGEVLFSGILDEHSVHEKGGVRTEFFSLRSRAAVLLDNEAVPGQLRMPSLRLMETRFLLPYGIRAEAGDFSPKAGELVIEKGTSCWQAVCRFAESFLHCTPHCTREGTLRFAERAVKTLHLSDVQETELLRRPYAQISRVVVQNAHSGAYNAVYENEAAAGVCRERYLSAYAKTAPRSLIADGERQSLRLRVVCGGLVDGDPGDLCSFPTFGASCEKMRLTALRYRFAQGEEKTELTFEPAAVY